MCDIEPDEDAGLSIILKISVLVLRDFQHVIKDETASLAVLTFDNKIAVIPYWNEKTTLFLEELLMC